ncbi:hypothetical protein FM076_32770 [Streptomyces albus subsp. chlorinus]|uniref:endonuclease/exonuclease/phosphatase family protein n=1 Tax=Streptomyces albus TaxID=1888 RepID=UPI00156E5454|nr:endonuclease/exonuclease/phosphatase family protein [Streptomyces albus]NSC25667.1 hypothetical protein [Streptomyces albus subsp. chlorinus]
MREHASRRHLGKRRWVAVLAAAGFVAPALVAVDWTSPPAHAVERDRVAGQWNMNGERDGLDGTVPESRWLTQIRRMLNDDGVEVASLQEAGNGPPPSSRQSDRVFPQPGVTEHLYNIGTNSRPDIVNIYWADPGQQRNGLAIASRETARDAVQLPVGGRFNSRPMMGVQFGETWYFNAHALSNGPSAPNDAEDIIETARQFMARYHPGQHWVVLADFNRNPGRMPANLQNHIVASNQPTHQGGGELDFAYMENANNSTVNAVRGGTNSDHTAYVRYLPNPYCGGSQLGRRAEEEKKGDHRDSVKPDSPGAGGAGADPRGTVPSPGAGAGAAPSAPAGGSPATGIGDAPAGGASPTGVGDAAPSGSGARTADTAPSSPDAGAAATDSDARDTGTAESGKKDLERRADSADPEEQCYTPVPGKTYRVFPHHLDNAVLADEDPEGNAAPPTVKKPSGSDTEEVQVLFSTEPGQYLLAFKDGWCLTRYAGPSNAVTEVPCDPQMATPSTAHWKFHKGQIVTPDLSGTLQPSPNKLGAPLKTETSFYQWRFEPLR